MLVVRMFLANLRAAHADQHDRAVRARRARIAALVRADLLNAANDSAGAGTGPELENV